MTPRRAFTVELTDEQIEEIEQHVASGAYPSTSDVVAAGVAELSPDFVRDNSSEWLAFLEGVRETSARLDRGEEPTYTAEDIRARRSARRARESL